MGIDFLLSGQFVFLSIMATVSLLIDVFRKNSSQSVYTFSIFALSGTAILSLMNFLPSGEFSIYAIAVKLGLAGQHPELVGRHAFSVFNGMIKADGYSAFFDVLFCLSAIMTLLASRSYLENMGLEKSEFYTLVLFSVTGMMLVAHSNSLLILFIGIEIMSVSFYILSGYNRTQSTSVEAALKYFLLGAFATGFLLYGMALVYGSTGSLDYSTIAMSVSMNAQFPALLAMGVGLMLVGLGFKTAVFPFHQWAPDVYQGAPTVVTGFMSTAGKAAAISAFIPFVIILMPVGAVEQGLNKIQLIVSVIAALTMLIGNISALAQTNVKRMLAFSSVAHAGYLMMGIVSANVVGATGIMFYVAAYLFMQIGAFILLSVLEQSEDQGLELEDFNGLSKRRPVLAALMAIFMFSLAGIPPFAGFFGKYYLFIAAINSGYTWLAIVAVISSVISVFFYIGLIVNMYFKEGQHDREQEYTVGYSGVALALSTIGVILLGILPSSVLKTIQIAFFGIQ